MHFQALTDAQWLQLEPLFEKPAKRGRGKPHTPWRSVLNSILYVLATGTKWEALPKEPAFASKSAAHRWFIFWDKNGFLERVLNLLADPSMELKFPSRRNRHPGPNDSVEMGFIAS